MTLPPNFRRAALSALGLAAVAACGAAAAQSASLPLESYRSFQATTPGYTDRFMRHLYAQGVTSVVDTASSYIDKLDATFLIHRGLADPSCYSLEANNASGSYLRHQNGVVVLAARASDGNPPLFDQDATWCAVPALAGSGVSLQSKNYPDRYLRHENATLLLSDGSDHPATFAEDATWQVVTAVTDAAPAVSFTYPQPGQVTGPGTLPPKVASVEYLGPVGSTTGAFPRDLGFSGVVGGRSVWTFGDTFAQRADGSAVPCATDSAAYGNFGQPTRVSDLSLNGICPQEWIPFDATEQANGGGGRFAEGGTNVVEYAPGKGLVWFLKNDRPNGQDDIIGAGVATVAATDAGPVATRTMDTMWNPFEPSWGDIGATYDSRDGKVYVYGHGPASAGMNQNVYLARVPGGQATDVSAYEYWDESAHAWTRQRLATGDLGTIKISRDQAIFLDHEVGQSNAFWSNYYNTWMFAYGADVGYTDVMVKTAPALEGPWAKGFTIASTCPNDQCSAIRYAIAPHPEYDPTGKTLLVTWTDSNVVYAARITWQ